MYTQGSLHCWLIFIVRIACMQLLLLAWRQYRWPFIAVMALSLASAALGIGLIAFINVRLIEMTDTSLSVLPEFLGLLLLLMAVTLGSAGADHTRAPFRFPFAQRVYQAHPGHSGRAR